MEEAMNRQFCASVFIIDPNTLKILLVHHKKFHKWVQPGGHIESGETPEEAAVREVYEETGIKVNLLGEHFPRESDFIKPMGIQCNRNLRGEIHIDILYTGVPRDSIEVTINPDENDGVKWFSREELNNLDVFPDILITMDHILKTYFHKEEF